MSCSPDLVIEKGALNLHYSVSTAIVFHHSIWTCSNVRMVCAKEQPNYFIREVRMLTLHFMNVGLQALVFIGQSPLCCLSGELSPLWVTDLLQQTCGRLRIACRTGPLHNWCGYASSPIAKPALAFRLPSGRNLHWPHHGVPVIVEKTCFACLIRSSML